MADIKANPALELQRVRMNIAKMNAAIERQRFELIEMDDRRTITETNIEASEKALKDLRAKLREMEKGTGD